MFPGKNAPRSGTRTSKPAKPRIVGTGSMMSPNDSLRCWDHFFLILYSSYQGQCHSEVSALVYTLHLEGWHAMLTEYCLYTGTSAAFSVHCPPLLRLAISEEFSGCYNQQMPWSWAHIHTFMGKWFPHLDAMLSWISCQWIRPGLLFCELLDSHIGWALQAEKANPDPE